MSVREWSRGAWAGAASVIAVLAAVVAVAIAVGADDDDAGAEPSAETTSGSESTPSTPSAPSPTAPDKPEPPPEIDYRAAAERAAQAGLAPFVPDGRTWVVTAADYRNGSWRLVVEDGRSQARVVQASGVEPRALVSRQLVDAREGEAVDLARWQLGTWSSWADASRHALTREFDHGVVVVTGSDPASVRSATQSLLTYESPRGGEGG